MYLCTCVECVYIHSGVKQNEESSFIPIQIYGKLVGKECEYYNSHCRIVKAVRFERS